MANDLSMLRAKLIVSCVSGVDFVEPFGLERN